MFIDPGNGQREAIFAMLWPWPDGEEPPPRIQRRIARRQRDLLVAGGVFKGRWRDALFEVLRPVGRLKWHILINQVEEPALEAVYAESDSVQLWLNRKAPRITGVVVSTSGVVIYFHRDASLDIHRADAGYGQKCPMDLLTWRSHY